MNERGSVGLLILIILSALIVGLYFYLKTLPAEQDLKIVEVTDSYIKVEFNGSITPDEVISFVQSEVKGIIKDVKRIKEIKIDRENGTILISLE
ncbi:hypothetical protein [Geoglobus ahangari]